MYLFTDMNVVFFFQLGTEAELTPELLDTDEQDNSDDVEQEEIRSEYMEEYVLPECDVTDNAHLDRMEEHPVFLARYAQHHRFILAIEL